MNIKFFTKWIWFFVSRVVNNSIFRCCFLSRFVESDLRFLIVIIMLLLLFFLNPTRVSECDLSKKFCKRLGLETICSLFYNCFTKYSNCQCGFSLENQHKNVWTFVVIVFCFCYNRFLFLCGIQNIGSVVVKNIVVGYIKNVSKIYFISRIELGQKIQKLHELRIKNMLLDFEFFEYLG